MTQANEIHWDLLVIGGGINGVGIANDAASRGLKVLLCEKNDLASATSSASSKLIHGGLRYLEHYEFSLVKKALAEREILLKKAPHIVWPLRFILPYKQTQRPVWLIRIGLFLYDHLTKRNQLPASKLIHFQAKNSPLINTIHCGFEYSDAWVDDARLVVLNAMAAKQNGAVILTHTECKQAQPTKTGWQVKLNDLKQNKTVRVKAKCVVNATGPWVESLFSTVLHKPSPQQIRLVQGSHIVVPKIHTQDKAYILQNDDKRIVFVIPYETNFSLIGTTDLEYQGDPELVKITQPEIDYLIKAVNGYFKHKISNKDIIHSYAGVRPLVSTQPSDERAGKAQFVTRDYQLNVQSFESASILLSVFGGKITTYRKLAKTAVDKLAEYFPDMGQSVTETQVLPGGDFNQQTELLAELAQAYPWLPIAMLKRMVRSYGTLTYQIILHKHSIQDLGICFEKEQFYQAEVDYLIRYEWASSLTDILWRRSKLGLSLSSQAQLKLARYLYQALDT